MASEIYVGKELWGASRTSARVRYQYKSSTGVRLENIWVKQAF